MRIFYSDEGPIDTLLQIAAGAVKDGDLVSKADRDVFVQLDWVARCHGWNVITEGGRKAVHALKLRRPLPDAGTITWLAPGETSGPIAASATAGCASDASAVHAAAFDRLQRIMTEMGNPVGLGDRRETRAVGILTAYGAGCILEGLRIGGFEVARARPGLEPKH